MSVEMGYSGLRNNAPFKLSSATTAAINDDPKQIIGKVVAITDDFEVGYGDANDPPVGVVTQIEVASTNDPTHLVTVAWGQTFESIPCAGTELPGEYLACDGVGGVVKSTTATCCVALGVDTTNEVCTIKIV